MMNSQDRPQDGAGSELSRKHYRASQLVVHGVGAAEVARHYPAYPSPYVVDVTPGSFSNWWNALRRRKLSIALITLLCLAAGIIVSRLQRPIYQSQAALEYIQPSDRPSAFQGTGAS